MKKLLVLIILSVCLLFPAFGKGEGEDEQLSINFAKQGPAWIPEWYINDAAPPLKVKWEGSLFVYLADKFEAETGIKINIFHIPEGAETVKDINARLSSPDPYDVICVYGGKISIYNSDRFTVNLRDYLPKKFFDQFIPSTLAQFNTNPNEIVRILPNTAWTVLGAVDFQVFEEADIDLPNVGWTIAEFETMAEEVKKIGKYAAYIACSGSYDQLGWFSAFGAKLFDDEGKLAINSPEGIKALNYMKKVIDNGWSPPGPSALGWGDSIRMREEHQVAFLSYSAAGDNSVRKSITYPRATGVEKVPVMCGPDASMVFDNRDIYGEELGEVKLKAAIEFLELLTDGEGEFHYMGTRSQRISPIAGYVPDFMSPAYKDVVAITAEHGVFDQAMGNPFYSLIRVNLGMAMGLCFSGEKSAKEALDWFVNETNKEIGY